MTSSPRTSWYAYAAFTNWSSNAAAILQLTQGGSIKLCDFGQSVRVAGGSVEQIGVGTLAYTAPEVFQRKRAPFPLPLAPLTRSSSACTYATDIYSLGATMCAALQGQLPSAADSPPVAMIRIMQGRYIQVPRATATGEAVPPKLARLLQTCIAQDPAQRPSAAAVLADLARMSSERHVSA